MKQWWWKGIREGTLRAKDNGKALNEMVYTIRIVRLRCRKDGMGMQIMDDNNERFIWQSGFYVDISRNSLFHYGFMRLFCRRFVQRIFFLTGNGK